MDDASESTKGEHDGFDLSVRGALLQVPPVWEDPPPADVQDSPLTVRRRRMRAPLRAAKPVVLPAARRVREFFTRETLLQQHSIGLDVARRYEDLADRLDAVDAALGALGRDLAGVTSRLEVATSQLGAAAAFAETAARRVAVSLGDEVLVRTGLGYVLCSADDLGSLTYLVEAGEWEPGTQSVLARLLSKGMTFVDVGANLGLHSLLAARAIGEEGRVLAVEPYARTADLLARTLTLNGYAGRTEVHRCALSREEGRGRLYLGGSSGEHSLVELDGPASVDVGIATLDAVLAGRPVDVVKIDVEGAEIDVLDGGRQAFSGNVVAIVEFGPSHLKRRGVTVDEWIDRFTELGFTLHAIDEPSGSVRAIGKSELESVNSINIVMAREGSSGWERLRPV